MENTAESCSVVIASSSFNLYSHSPDLSFTAHAIINNNNNSNTKGNIFMPNLSQHSLHISEDCSIGSEPKLINSCSSTHLFSRKNNNNNKIKLRGVGKVKRNSSELELIPELATSEQIHHHIPRLLRRQQYTEKNINNYNYYNNIGSNNNNNEEDDEIVRQPVPSNLRAKFFGEMITSNDEFNNNNNNNSDDGETFIPVSNERLRKFCDKVMYERKRQEVRKETFIFEKEKEEENNETNNNNNTVSPPLEFYLYSDMDISMNSNSMEEIKNINSDVKKRKSKKVAFETNIIISNEVENNSTMATPSFAGLFTPVVVVTNENENKEEKEKNKIETTFKNISPINHHQIWHEVLDQEINPTIPVRNMSEHSLYLEDDMPRLDSIDSIYNLIGGGGGEKRKVKEENQNIFSFASSSPLFTNTRHTRIGRIESFSDCSSPRKIVRFDHNISLVKGGEEEEEEEEKSLLITKLGETEKIKTTDIENNTDTNCENYLNMYEYPTKSIENTRRLIKSPTRQEVAMMHHLKALEPPRITPINNNNNNNIDYFTPLPPCRRESTVPCGNFSSVIPRIIRNNSPTIRRIHRNTNNNNNNNNNDTGGALFTSKPRTTRLHSSSPSQSPPPINIHINNNNNNNNNINNITGGETHIKKSTPSHKTHTRLPTFHFGKLPLLERTPRPQQM